MKDYTKQAIQTEARPNVDRRRRLDQHIRLVHAGMGLASEAGEFNDALKKHIFYGKDMDPTNLKEEIGDILWYCALALDEIDGSSFQDIMETNIQKLRTRYPGMFTEYDAQNRNLNKEREVLEKSVPVTPPKVSTPYHQLVEKFGEAIIQEETKRFNTEFYVNMKREASEEDLDIFYFRWWRKESKKSISDTAQEKNDG